MGDVGDVDRRSVLDDAAGLAGAGLHMALDHMHAAHLDAILRGHDREDLAGLALVATGDHDHLVALLDLQLRVHHSTSGASEMIFMKLRALSSRVTGPKMRVPIGSFCLLISTAALVSKRIRLPSGRRISLAVRTMTARCTSPFFTLPRGVASFTETTMTSPPRANFPLGPPRPLLPMPR